MTGGFDFNCAEPEVRDKLQSTLLQNLPGSKYTNEATLRIYSNIIHIESDRTWT